MILRFLHCVPLVAAVVLWFYCCSGSAWPAICSNEADLNQEIERVQKGLLPAAVVKGSPLRSMTLVDRMFAYHATAVSIAVIHNGAIRWSQGFGILKLGGAPVTPDTLFQAAVAALRLVQSGKLNLDEDVNHYLKSWKLPTKGFTEQRRVTLRELLTHTAGTTVRGFPGYAAGAAIPTLLQILDGVPPANTPPIRVDTIPGTT
jgi:CubicO group peptidase (beta-lactamase class C family)